MHKGSSLIFGVLILLPYSLMAQTLINETTRYKIYEIPTDAPPTLESEADNAYKPFFASTPEGEVMEQVELLDNRIKALEEMQSFSERGEIRLISKGGVIIESDGPNVLISAPGEIQFKAKKVDLPKP